MPIAPSFVSVGVIALLASILPAQDPGTASDPAVFEAARLCTSPAPLAKADYDAIVRDMLQFVDGHADSWYSAIVMSRASEWLERCADRMVFLETAQRILRERNPRGGAELRLRAWTVELLKRRGDEAGLLESGDHYPGFLANAAAIGPFGDDFPSAIRNAYAPEAGLRFDESAPGKSYNDPLRWKALRRRDFDSYFDLQDIGNLPGGVRYVRVQIKADMLQNCYLEVSTPGSVFAWWNGEKKFEYDADSQAKEPLAPQPVVLRSGWNQLLIKLESRGSNWISARLVDGQGRAIPGVTTEPALVDRGMSQVAGVADFKIPYTTSEARLTGMIDATQDPSKRSALLAMRALVRIVYEKTSPAIKDLRAAVELVSDNPNLWILLADALLNSGYLPDSDAKNRARECVDKALALQNDHVPGLLMRADLLSRDDRMEEALELLATAEKSAPQSWLVPRQRAQIFRKLGWNSEKYKSLQTAVARAPRKSELQLEFAREAEAMGDVDTFRKHVELAASTDLSNRAISVARQQLWHESGQEARVLGERQRFLKWYGTQYERLQIAEFLELIGDRSGSDKAWKQLIDEAPTNTSYPLRYAEILRSRRQDEEARTLYEKVHAAVPGTHGARDWLRHAGGGLLDDDFFTKHRIDLMAAIRDYKPKKEHEKAPDVLLVDQQIERIAPDGSVESEITSVYRVNDQQGVEQHGSARAPGEILEIKIVHTDGTIDEPVMAKGDMAMPGLKPGDFIIVRSRVFQEATPGGRPRLGRFQFQSLEHPFVLSQYVVSVPRDLGLRLVEKNFDGEHVVIEGDAEVTHKFTKTDSPRVLPERSAPDPIRFLPWVQLGISNTEAQLNRSYRTHLRSMDVTEEIREAAEKAVTAAKAQTDRDRARALYEFTNDVLLERGGGTATRSLLEKRGNPNSLYGALLTAAAVPFDYVLVRAIQQGGDDEPEPEFLDASRYNHVLFRVRPREGGDPVWVDVSNKLQPFGQRPSVLSGSEAFITNADAPEVTELPLLPDEESVPAELSSSVELQGGQAAKVHVEITFHNQLAWSLREQIRNQTADIKKTIASQISNQLLEGVELEKYDFPNMADASTPLRFVFDGTVANFLRDSGSGSEAPALLQPFPFARQFAGKAKRKLPVRFRNLIYLRESARIAAGTGQEFGEIPKDVVKTGFGVDYELRFVKKENAVEITKKLKVAPGTIPAAEFPTFLALCREIEEAEQLKVPVREKTAK